MEIQNMKTNSYKGSTASAWGQPITELAYDYDVAEFESVDEVRAAGEWPKDSEIVTFVNNTRKISARQNAQNAALVAAGYKKPTLKTDDQLKLRTLYNVFLSVEGTSEAEAREKASAALGGIAWADKK